MSVLIIALIFLAIVLFITGVFTVLSVENLKKNSSYSSDVLLTAAGEYLTFGSVLLWVSSFLLIVGAIFYIFYFSKQTVKKKAKYFIVAYFFAIVFLLLVVGLLSAIAVTKMSSSTNFDPKRGTSDSSALFQGQTAAGLSLGSLSLLVLLGFIYFSQVTC